MGSGRSSSLHIGGDSSVVFDSGQASGASDRLARVAFRDVLGEPPLSLDKGKSRIDEIKYLVGSEYLKLAVQNALAVGPSQVEPLYGETFAKLYRPPFVVQVWAPDILTFYVVQVPKMVCFFEVAFDNGLCFPVHPFINRVLQHFNVCPSQLSPNFWGIGLLVFFRGKGLGVPNIAMFLDLFSVKEAVEGFLYLSRCASAPLIISDLPSSHRFWKERYFFVSGRSWEYDSLDKEDTLGVPTVWTTPENLRELCFGLVRSSFRKLYDVPNFALAVRFSGIRPDLSPEDEVLKLKLAKCLRRVYSELIRSDIPGSSGSSSSCLATLRSSSPSVMKFSHVRPPVSKPTKGELLARVEMLSQRSRSVKRKTPDILEKGRPAWGKVLRLGMSSSSPSTHARVQGQVSLPPAKVPKSPSSQLCSGFSAKDKDSSGKAAEPPLEVMPITV